MNNSKYNVNELKSSIEGKNTSQVIRYLYSIVEGDSKVAQVERLLKLLGVTTKNGDNIRYQHVRNILTQNQSIKL